MEKTINFKPYKLTPLTTVERIIASEKTLPCTGCAFEHNADGCRAAGDECTQPAFENHAWKEVPEC